MEIEEELRREKNVTFDEFCVGLTSVDRKLLKVKKRRDFRATKKAVRTVGVCLELEKCGNLLILWLLGLSTSSFMVHVPC